VRTPRSLAALLLLCSLLLPGGLPRAEADPVAEALCQRLEAMEADSALSVGSCRVASWPILQKLYGRRGYRPVWTRPESVARLVRAIEESYHEGLNPKDYHLAWIRSTLEENAAGRPFDPSRAASLDLLLTDAFIRLSGDSTCGREDPAVHQVEWSYKRTFGGRDPAAFFEQALASASIDRTIESWRIHHPYYERLKQALARYRAIRAEGGWGQLHDGAALGMGSSGPRVKALRKRIEAEYPGLGEAADPMRFDKGLHRAVVRFQELHALKPDGVVGPQTLAALNVPVEDRIDQIRINLERCRWVLKDLGDTFVLVDAAAFMVHFHKRGRTVWTGRAVVGQPYRDTPVLRSKITYLMINPTWTIPPTIRDEDVIPAYLEDPFYLSTHGITIIDRQGRAVHPDTIDWSLYPGEPFPYRLVQGSGPHNPLGRIKIFFPNRHYIYLHDTPEKGLFDQEDRRVSSGCIRIERPFVLAAWLMDNHNGWTAERLMKSADTGMTWRLNLPEPVPVLVMYPTVTVDDEGAVSFGRDPYDRDPAMLEGLGRETDISPAP
jgi:murein L,D-transpeptidase YcbB/YkuD